MIEKFKETFLTPKFIRFFVAGVTAFIVDTAVLYFVYLLILDGEQVQITLFASSAVAIGFALEKLISATFGASTSFILNRYWAFKATHESVLSQLWKFISVIAFNAIVGALVYDIYYYIASTYFGWLGNLAPAMSNVATTGTIMFISYFFYSKFVFSERRKSNKKINTNDTRAD